MAHVRTQLPHALTAALLATVLAAVLLAGGLSFVWRHGGKMTTGWSWAGQWWRSGRLGRCRKVNG